MQELELIRRKGAAVVGMVPDPPPDPPPDEPDDIKPGGGGVIPGGLHF